MSVPANQNEEAAVLELIEQDLATPETHAPPVNAADVRGEASLGIDVVRSDPEVQALIRQANTNLGVLGFTEHGFRHVGLVSNIARNVLRLLGYDGRQQ